jgi:phage tail-like protein
MTTAARSRPLVGKYAFWVRDLSSRLIEAKFQKATGAGLTLNIGEHREGGAMAPMKEATTATYANILLEHGVFENTEIYDWVKEVINMLTFSPQGAGVASPDHLRNWAVDQLRRDRTVLKTVVCYNCQPASFKPGEFDNTSTELQVEELELALEYFDVVSETAGIL